MHESIISQVYSVLDKYDKNYSKNGVLSNLNTWENNKSSLVELLRKHPNWNKDALSVIFEVTQSREIDRYTVNSYSNSVGQLSTDLDMPDNDRNNLYSALNIAIGAYAKLLPNEQAVANIKQYSGVSCSVGQKTSRAINKICQRYGLDKHPEYNARFAMLADSLNPLQVKRKALLSVHPCDYLEMSNENNSWSSCHCIREGEYHAGTLSYMNDAVSMIFYTIDEDVYENYHTQPKRTRQVFCYGDGILLQSRLYPQTDDEEARDIYRDIIQRTIALCLDVPNLWTLKRTQEDIDRYCRTHEDALQYTDYTYGSYKANVSLLKSVYTDDGKRIDIGNTAYCLDCSSKLYSNDSLYCDNCDDDDDYVTCEACGERIVIDSDDDYYVDGAHYCRDCVSWCDHCQEYTLGETTYVYNSRGNEISVCSYCRDEYYYYCEDCGEYFHRDRGEELEDGFRCQDCLDRYYLTCENCNEYIHHEDAIEVDGKLYCMNCAEEVRVEMEKVETRCLITV